MEKQTAPSPADLVSYTRKVLDSLRLPPIKLPTVKKPGKMRGVEFYGQRLPEVMMVCLRRYHRMKNTLPDPPLECKSLREKLFWSKFFVPMPIPTPADKLAVGKFIPKNIRDKVGPNRVYWISDRPNFPSSIKGPDGHYFLKANHSWGTAQSINFPIEESKRKELEKLARSWLTRKNYNLMGGEWWYSTIKPKLYLESKMIGENGSVPEYKFLCIKGKVVAIYHPIFEELRSVAISFYYPDFRWRGGVSTRTMPNPKTAPPADAKLLISIAEAIAVQFDFIRVDLYNPSPGVVILGELTLCPDAGIRGYIPEQFEHELGATWLMDKYFL